MLCSCKSQNSYNLAPQLSLKTKSDHSQNPGIFLNRNWNIYLTFLLKINTAVWLGCV